jgi:CBS domain-containing protein
MADLDRAGTMLVSELIEEDVVCVRPGATLHELAQALADANIGAVLVGDREKVAGIVSERDVVRAVAEGRDPDATPTVDVAHTTLVWCDATATVAEVAAEMMENYVRHALVEEDGRLIGIVSMRDLLGVYATAEDETE